MGKRTEYNKARRLKKLAEDPEYFRRVAREQYHRDLEKSRAKARARIKTPEARAYRLANQHKRVARLAAVTVEDLSAKILEEIRSSSNGRCCYCLKVFPISDLVLDHIYPISKGGSHAKNNLLPACASCNSSKRDKLPYEWLTSRRWSMETLVWVSGYCTI